MVTLKQESLLYGGQLKWAERIKRPATRECYCQFYIEEKYRLARRMSDGPEVLQVEMLYLSSHQQINVTYRHYMGRVYLNWDN